MAKATVRQDRDHIKFIRNPFLIKFNAQNPQIFDWFWLIWQRGVAHPGASPLISCSLRATCSRTSLEVMSGQKGISFMRVPRRVSATEKDLDLKNGKVGDDCLSNGETRMQLSPVYQSSTVEGKCRSIKAIKFY
jgi:hypothetical protein